jgi:hypothetical protein
MKYFLHSALLLFVLATPGICQDKQAPLKDKRISIRMEAQPLGEVFRYLIGNCDIPIGFEESVLDREAPDFEFEPNPATARHKMKQGDVQSVTTVQRQFQAGRHAITLYIEDGSVEQVFDEIVRQMENYKWEVNDDVVNIYPVKGRDPRFERLLGTRVKRFTIEKGQTVGDITKNIKALPEFISFMRENKLHFSGVREGFKFINKAQYGRVVNEGMDFSDLSFRDLLNRATRVKRGGWRLSRLWINSAGEEHINIDI